MFDEAFGRPAVRSCKRREQSHIDHRESGETGKLSRQCNWSQLFGVRPLSVDPVFVLDEDVAQDGDDAPAGHVEVSAEDVAVEREPGPDVERKNEENDQVDGSCDEWEDQIGKEESVDRMADFDTFIER